MVNGYENVKVLGLAWFKAWILDSLTISTFTANVDDRLGSLRNPIFVKF